MNRAAGKRGQQGMAMVEFAIALPLLVLLLLGVAEFGRMLFHYNNLLQASRDAGRYAASKAWNATLGRLDLSTSLQTEIKNVAVYGVPSTTAGFSAVVPGLTPDDVQVRPSASDARYIEVQLSYDFQPVIGSVLPSLFGNDVPLAVELNSTVVMRAL